MDHDYFTSYYYQSNVLTFWEQQPQIALEILIKEKNQTLGFYIVYADDERQ